MADDNPTGFNPSGFKSTGASTPLLANSIFGNTNTTPMSDLTAEQMAVSHPYVANLMSQKGLSASDAVTASNAPAPTPAPSPVNPTPTAAPSVATVGSRATSQQIGSAFASSTFLDNILNSYDQIAYHWKLHVTGDSNSSSHDVTIAETGKTSYNIKSVSVESQIAPSTEGRNTLPSQFKFTIQESGGISFLDSLANASLKAMVRNWLKSYYLLELSFMGYQDDMPVYIPVTDTQSSFVFQIAITDCQMHHDPGGSIYEFSAIPFDQRGYDDDILNLSDRTVGPDTSTKEAFSTVTDFFNSLKKKINDNIYNRYLTDLITYDFQFYNDKMTQDFSNYSLDKIQLDEKQSMFGQSVGKTNPKLTTYHFTSGTPISEIVNTIHSYVYKQTSDENKEDEKSPIPSASDSGTVNTVFMLIPSVTQGEYVPSLNRYKYKVTYYIKSYRSQKINPSVNLSDTDPSQKNLQWYVKNGAVRKQYNYILTGKNTEVLDFDTTVNFQWMAILPNVFGLKGTTFDSAVTGAVYDKAKFDQLQTVSDYNQTYQNYQTAETNFSTARDQAISDGTLNPNGTFSSTASQTDITNLQTLQSNADNLSAALTSKQAQAQIATQNYNTRLNNTFNAAAAAAPQSSSQQFAENIDPSTDTTVKYMVSYQQAVNQTNNAVGTGIMSGNDGYRTIYGGMLDQFFTDSMVQITLQIKGDPYWLGALNSSINGTNPFTTTNTDSCPILGQDSCFLFTMKFPTLNVDGEIANPNQLNNSNAFNGIYTVQTITSTFEDGKFHQTLHAYRNSIDNPNLT